MLRALAYYSDQLTPLAFSVRTFKTLCAALWRTAPTTLTLLEYRRQYSRSCYSYSLFYYRIVSTIYVMSTVPGADMRRMLGLIGHSSTHLGILELLSTYYPVKNKKP